MDPLEQCTTVCLSPIPWSGLWTSRHEIASHLAQRRAEVLFVDPPRNALRPRRQAAAGRSRTMPDGIRVVEPPPYMPYGIVGSQPLVLQQVMRINASRYARFVI